MHQLKCVCVYILYMYSLQMYVARTFHARNVAVIICFIVAEYLPSGGKLLLCARMQVYEIVTTDLRLMNLKTYWLRFSVAYFHGHCAYSAEQVADDQSRFCGSLNSVLHCFVDVSDDATDGRRQLRDLMVHTCSV